jgi:hypothetical protein
MTHDKESKQEAVALDMKNGIEKNIVYPQKFVKAYNPYEHDCSIPSHKR